jgi:hypothetical protein
MTVDHKERGSTINASCVFVFRQWSGQVQSALTQLIDHLQLFHKTTLCPARTREPPKYVPIAPAPKTRTFKRSDAFMLDMVDDCKIASEKQRMNDKG